LAAVVPRRVILRLSRLVAASGLAVALVALPACKNAGEQKPAATAAPAPKPPRTGTVVVHTSHGQLTFHVELAITNAEHERGLMFRTHLDDEAGMLFLFERPSQQTFWMKNTLIPLDMIFIGADHRIVGVVAKAEPQTETPRFVPGVSQFVLELAGGVAAERNLGAGDLVEFKGVDVP
jgi:uncharacterized protein